MWDHAPINQNPEKPCDNPTWGWKMPELIEFAGTIIEPCWWTSQQRLMTPGGTRWGSPVSTGGWDGWDG